MEQEVSIATISPGENDVIIIHFRMNAYGYPEMDYQKAMAFFQEVCSAFPNNKVLIQTDNAYVEVKQT